MKRLIFLSVVAICCNHGSFGQSPPGINYQGVARDLEGKPLVLKNISIKISIVKGSAQGEVEFAEEHVVKTNSFGLFTLVIGTGDTVVGNFNFISWATGDKWLQVEMDPEGGYAYYLMGSQQFMSVPYAFYAKYSGNGLAAGQGISIQNSIVTNTGDADSNPSNELNTSVTLGTDRTLRITDGGGTKEVDLTSLTANPNLGSVLTQGNHAGGQRITNLGAPVGGTDAATKDYVDTRPDGDASATNEIQDLQLTGNELKVTNNTGATPINLSPYLDNTDQQTLTLTGSSLQISNGNAVDLGTLDNDSQSLAVSSSGTDRTIDITNGTGITLSVADNDNNSTNEIQDLALVGNELKITNNTTATGINLAPYLDNTDAQGLTFNLATHTLGISGNAGTVNLSGFLDNTDDQTLTYTPATKNLAIAGGNTVNIPETQDLNQVLTQGTSAGAQKITNLGAPTAALDAANKQYVDAADAVLSSAIATTYAFKTAFAFTNSTLLAVNDAAIPFTTEAFDDFNVLAGSSFTAMESGTYVIIVDGGYNALLAGATFSVSLNGTKYPVALVQPWGGTGARFNASMMFKLNPGDVISLVGDNVLVGGAFTGSLSGYKL